MVVAEQGRPPGRGGPEGHGGDVDGLSGLESRGGEHIHWDGGPEAVLDEEGTVLVHERTVLRIDRHGILDRRIVHAGHLHEEFRIALHAVGEAPIGQAGGNSVGARVGHVLKGLPIVQGGRDGEADMQLSFGKGLTGFIARGEVVRLKGLDVGVLRPEPHRVHTALQRPDFRQIHIGVTQ